MTHHAPDPASDESWQGWGRFTWEAVRWTLVLCVASSLILALSLPHQPLTPASPALAKHAAGIAVSVMRISAIFAVFLPLFAAVRRGTWSRSPLYQWIPLLMVYGLAASAAIYAGTLLAWLSLTRGSPTP
jgi:hypothetical protein